MIRSVADYGKNQLNFLTERIVRKAVFIQISFFKMA